jgi:hypothetical protein
MMAKTLGQIFFKAKKQPVPMTVTRLSSIAERAAKLRDSTLFHMSHGG